MSAGYSGTPLEKKLGIKQGHKIATVNAPDYYFDLFEVLPDIEVYNPDEGGLDFIHFFTTDENELRHQLPIFKERIKKDGLIWVSWPKKASKVATSVDENLVRATALECGLVDVKVCAIDEVWSGLKLVYRIKDR